MAESHEQLFPVLDVLDELGNVLQISDLFQHSEYGFVRSAVLGPIEGSSCSRDGGVDIYSARAEVPYEGSGAIQLVLSVQDEQDFQGLHQLGMRLILLLVQSIEHVEEVLDVAHVLGGHVVFSTDSVSETV